MSAMRDIRSRSSRPKANWASRVRGRGARCRIGLDRQRRRVRCAGDAQAQRVSPGARVDRDRVLRPRCACPLPSAISRTPGPRLARLKPGFTVRSGSQLVLGVPVRMVGRRVRRLELAARACERRCPSASRISSVIGAASASRRAGRSRARPPAGSRPRRRAIPGARPTSGPIAPARAGRGAKQMGGRGGDRRRHLAHRRQVVEDPDRAADACRRRGRRPPRARSATATVGMLSCSDSQRCPAVARAPARRARCRGRAAPALRVLAHDVQVDPRGRGRGRGASRSCRSPRVFHR